MTNNKGLRNAIGLNLVGGVVGVNQCEATDMSWYCQFSRFFSIIMMIITLIGIIYILYTLAKIYIFKKKQ